MKRTVLFLSVVLLGCCIVMLMSCKQKGSAKNGAEKEIKMKYAECISLYEGDGYVLAEISNPWDSTKVLHRYVLVPKDSELPARLPEGDIVRTPLSRILCYVSVHTSLFNELGALSSIGAVGDAEYMKIEKLQHDIKVGRVVDCGSSNAISVEKIIDFSPDAVIVSAMEDNNSYAKILNVGIPVIECADYMETGPLARAEWVRFYGMLVGKSNVADALFASVESKYKELKQKVDCIAERPTVLDGKKMDSSWYVAGNGSTVGQLIRDAGGVYVFADENNAGSVPYSPEVVLDRGIDADYWMLKYYKENGDMSYRELEAEWSGYGKLKAFSQHKVFGVNLSATDFYLSTPFHPEVLLREYVNIFHPGVLKDIQPNQYFKNLAE